MSDEDQWDEPYDSAEKVGVMIPAILFATDPKALVEELVLHRIMKDSRGAANPEQVRSQVQSILRSYTIKVETTIHYSSPPVFKQERKSQ